MPPSIVSSLPHWLGAYARRGTPGLSAAPCASSGVGHLSAPSPANPLDPDVAPRPLLLPIGVALHRSPPPVVSLTNTPSHSPSDAAPLVTTLHLV
ncbi:uncharacterized protein SCHCODRAFT_02687839 [Schizophyllum commune H4-8]|uniref:uncharacterized protein n=1 Tax=Schizophyllum commune (strain H4-8 / FGSC 9210) TaxID=578458 RepID=UPI00215E15AE|nr:uncharacterized protein SCHCODRAFT_02687839 [Schizophyllum commune H4-8]KAI5893802.1 hypothetical protein SCHCODRAFT_02687839 [Schizophyllum commune H4-8]